VELLELPDVSPVYCPRLTAIQKACEDDGLVHFDFGRQLNVSIVHHTSAEATKGLAGLADASGYFLVERAVR